MNVVFEIYTVHAVHVGKTAYIYIYIYDFLAIHAGHAYQAVLDTHSVHALHAAKTVYVINGFGAVHAGHAIVAMRALVVSLLERSFFVGLRT